VCAAGGVLAAWWAPAHANLWMSGPPLESLCDLPTTDDGQRHRLSLRFLAHEHGLILTDEKCPANPLYVHDASAFSEFSELVDPDGKHFGIPLGAGTYNQVDVVGRIVAGAGRFAIEKVVEFSRHDVIDREWLRESDYRGPSPAERAFIAQIPPPTMDVRVVRGFKVYTAVQGALDDAAVGALLKAAQTDGASICRITAVKENFAQVECHWELPYLRNRRVWIYARAGTGWRLLKKVDSVTL
jgi:hypothetical protein